MLIKTEEDYDKALERIETLIDKEELGKLPESILEELEVLVKSVTLYEVIHYPEDFC